MVKSLRRSISIIVSVIIAFTFEQNADALQIFNQAVNNYCTESNSATDCPSNIPVQVGSIRSDKSILNIDYFDLNLCLVQSSYLPVKSVGQGLLAHFYHRPSFNISFGLNQRNVQICNVTYNHNNSISKKKFDKLLYAIRNNYMLYWSIDDMPLRWCYPVIAGNKRFCTDGFPIGCHIDKRGKMTTGCYLLDLPSLNDVYVIFNHLDIEISYTTNYMSERSMLIAAVVRPRSQTNNIRKTNTVISPILSRDSSKRNSIVSWSYTYSISYKRIISNRITRRDFFASYSPYSFRQCSSLFNILLIVTFLTLMIVRIFYYSFGRSDAMISSVRSNQIMLKHGWRAIRGDVFRSPKYSLLLSVLTGSGIQCLLATFYTLALAWIGFISFSNPSELLSSAILSYVSSASTASYISAVTYKTIDGKDYILSFIMTPTLIPGIFLAILYILNSISLSMLTLSTPPQTFILLLIMWLLVLCPLSCIGSYFGFKREALQLPVKPSKTPRQIPEYKFYKYPLLGVAIAGALIFSVVVVPISVFLDCLQTHNINESYGYSILYFILTILLCIQISVYLCHLYLCAENYHWWWRAFLAGGSVAIFILLYSCYFYLTRISYSSNAYSMTYFIVYFGYCTVLAIYFSLMTGSITFIAAFIYAKFVYQYANMDIIQV
ncbi:Transmembrane 9 superfamily member 2 [Trichoplax sp. H2]|nr:Transmembrane 9 superfamily member 2 [Trichoplax sp. H2]|eukprot:RDD45455.1 Transmembrane 9 superfamily member 2 [Trichoplax sp. H2]